jgi:uncharacterized protein (DUF1697 family)
VFLRAINVGGRNVAMEELRQTFIDMGFAGVESFIASGNIVFQADAATAVERLEVRVEQQLEVALGYPVTAFVREPGELLRIAEAAFTGVAGSHQVGLLKVAPDDGHRAATLQLQTENDLVDVVGREVHWLRPEPSASKLANGQFERALKAPMTFRTVTTLRRLAAKYA